MKIRHSCSLAAIAILALGLSSCSWLMVQKAPSDKTPAEVEPPIQCTESQTPPVVDTIGSVVLAGTGMTLIAANARGSTPAQQGGMITGVFITGGGAAMVGSTVYGFTNTAQCTSFKERRAQFEDNYRAAVERARKSFYESGETAYGQYREKAARWRPARGEGISSEERAEWIRELVTMKCSTGDSCSAAGAECGEGLECAPTRDVCVDSECVRKRVTGFGGVSAVDRYTSAKEIAEAIERQERVRGQTVFTVSEAATALGIAEETVYDWIENDTLSATEVDEGYRISRGDLKTAWRQMRGGDPFAE